MIPPSKKCFIIFSKNATDKTKQDLCHPSFPLILNQLSNQEIIMLLLVNKNIYEVEFRYDWDDTKNIFYNETETKNQLLDKLSFLTQEQLWWNNNHLHSLSLFGCWEYQNQQPIHEHGIQVASIKYSRFKLTEIGQQFLKACMSEKAEELINNIINNNGE